MRRAWQDPLPRLLIFDNCEEEALLAAWRPVTGGCRVLITSRRTDWARELQVRPRPLALPARAENVNLLQRLAPAVDATMAALIAQEVGDLPLALHLAGSFLARYPQVIPESYLAQLRAQGPLEHRSLTGRGAAYSPTGHDLHVARTFAVSLGRLDPADPAERLARQLLARAACFASGESIPRALLGATVRLGAADTVDELLVEDALARLVSLGFLALSGRSAVIMHRLAAAYATELTDNDAAARAAVEAAVLDFLAERALGTYGLARLPFAASHLRRLVEQAQPRQDANSARLLNLWGRHLRDLGDLEEAFLTLQLALTRLRDTLGDDHIETLEGLRDVGNMHVRIGQYQQAQPYLEEYLSFYEQAQPPDAAKLANALDGMGTLHMALGRYPQAGTFLLRALALRQGYLGPEHVQTGASLINVGVWHLRTGQYAQALAAHARATTILVKRLGEEHPTIGMALGYQAHDYLGLGKPELARDMASQSLSIREKTLGPLHPETARGLTLLGIISMEQGHYAAAQANLEKSLAIRQKVLRAGHRDIGASLHQLGRLQVKMGAWEPAAKNLQRARAIMEQALGPDHPLTAAILVSLGELQEALGDTQAAHNLYGRGLASLEQQVDDTQRDVQRARQDITSLAPAWSDAIGG